MMRLAVVTLTDRPDLAPTTGAWRWNAFFKKSDTDLDEILKRESQCARSHDLMPTVLVLLEEQRPIGMVALCCDDLEQRPDLNPWLAGLYVDPAHRGKGYAMRLIQELEAFAEKSAIERLSLYTADAVGLYAKAGWATIETFESEGKIFHIMQKHL